MRFTEFRKAIASVPRPIQRDLEATIASVEQLADHDRQAAGHRVHQLIVVFGLNYGLPVETRFSLADCLLTDAEKNDLPAPSRH